MINERLAFFRKKKLYTQEMVAEKLNISRPTISKWEKGQCIPSTENVIKLSEIYGISTDELLGTLNHSNDRIFETNEHYYDNEKLKVALDYLETNELLLDTLVRFSTLSSKKRAIWEEVTIKMWLALLGR